MNQYDLKRHGRKLMQSQEKFVTTVMMLLGVFEKFGVAQKKFNEALDARDDWYEATYEAGRLQKDLVDKLLASNAALQTAYQETHVAVHENTERMERILAKMEAYFGTTGLDYDN